MTAIEFIENYKPSLMACVKSMDYKSADLAKKIRDMEPDIEMTDEYREHTRVFIEYMVENVGDTERENWRTHVCRMAVQYGLDTKSLDWKVKFIAMWDIVHPEDRVGNLVA